MSLLASRVRIVLTLAILSVIAVFVGNIHSQTVETTGYRAVENALKFPDGRAWGATSGITTDHKGNLWTFDRCGEENCYDSDLPPIHEFTASGTFIKSFGAGMFALPHGIYVDKEGNVWVADAGMGMTPGGSKKYDNSKWTKGQQVIKFTPDGKVLMRLGKAGIGGDGPDTFNHPTGVVVAPNGDIFVSDGHNELKDEPGASNARVLKFSKNGKFIKTWGELGSGPGQFSSPHAIAMDSSGRIFVVDRNNARIQIFEEDGKFRDQWKQFGRPSGIFIDSKDNIYVCGAQDRQTLQGIGSFKPGIRIGNTKDAAVSVLIPALEGPDGKPNTYEGCAGDGAGHVWAAGSHPHTGITEWVKANQESRN
jgi:sugar lactone lactonase YvrE